MKAIIITIGDELLIGQVINTNAAYIAEKLNTVGVEVQRMITISDDEVDIIKTFQENYVDNDLLIVTGGLGPTHDDITKKAICKFFDTDLVISQEAISDIKTFLQKRNYSWTPSAEEQALVPRGAQIIPNKNGTAPGIIIEQHNKFFVALPGVPHEMEAMIQDFVLPLFRNKSVGKVILHRTLKTTGIAESILAERIGNLDQILKMGKLAFLPSPLGVNLRLSVIDSDPQAAQSKVSAMESSIRKKADKFIYGVDDETLEEIVGRLLRERKLTIAIAESCTGGIIAHRISNVPGCSEYFERGIIAYSNQSKIDILQVPQELIEKHGAVSEEVVKSMALGVRQIAETDIGLSTTGIAGPTGGTAEKPVGLVWIGYSDKNGTIALKHHFGDNRLRVKERSAQAALNLVRKRLLQIE